MKQRATPFVICKYCKGDPWRYIESEGDFIECNFCRGYGVQLSPEIRTLIDSEPWEKEH